jgi:hypothetical protein
LESVIYSQTFLATLSVVFLCTKDFDDTFSISSQDKIEEVFEEQFLLLSTNLKIIESDG